MGDFGLLVLRLVTGLLLAGHGSQKLFGWFGGPGLSGMAGWLGSLGLRPGRGWAVLAGLGELVGGLLLALGFLNPLGSLLVIAVMVVATAKAHWGKPIWVTQGGAELPVTNAAVALGLALSGPGAYSLDAFAGIQVPGLVTVVAVLLGAVAVVAAIVSRPSPARVETAHRTV